MARVKRVTVVLANWCPHCVPLSLDNARKLANDLSADLRVLDIDKPEEEREADRLVEEHGDYVEDYIIPQVFLEYDGGRVEHIFTGFSEGVSVTTARWQDLFYSRFHRELLRLQNEQ
jgi:glutaredoxin